jgi:KDO2-lipid IV(A) lauroyltransferase
VSQNREDTELYYGQPHSFESILKGNVAVPEGAVPFVSAVAHYFIEPRTTNRSRSCDGAAGNRGAVRQEPGCPFFFCGVETGAGAKLDFAFLHARNLEYWLVLAVARPWVAAARVGAPRGRRAGLERVSVARPAAPRGLRNLELACPELSSKGEVRSCAASTAHPGLATGRVLPHDPLHRREHRGWIRTEGLDHYLAGEGARQRRADRHRAPGRVGAVQFLSLADGPSDGHGHRRLDNRRLDEFVNGIRCLHGNRVLHKDDFARGLLTGHAQGRDGGHPDGHEYDPAAGRLREFFGKQACTASGLARVALKTGAAVLPGFMVWEEAEGRYVLHFGPELAFRADRRRARPTSGRHAAVHQRHRELDSALS